MSTFFRIAVYLTFAMIVFNLVIAFIGSLSIFPVSGELGTGLMEESNALSRLTGLTGGMEAVWFIGTSLLGLASAALAIATKSLVPIGLYIFGEVFWTAWIRSSLILSSPSLQIPGEFLAIFFICMMFLFIAAIIGMMAGSG